MSKCAWIYVIAATFIAGALAWLIGRRSLRRKSWVIARPGRRTLTGPASADFIWDATWTPADTAVARHPAVRGKRPSGHREGVPRGPDDDPEFLRQLDQRIRGTSADSGE